MEEKKTKKISLSTVLLILAVIAIILMGVCIYGLNKDITKEIQKNSRFQIEIEGLSATIKRLQEKIESISEPIGANSSLKLGSYMIDEVREPIDECALQLKLTNKFKFYNDETGYSHIGKYEIKDNKLICNSESLVFGGAEYMRAFAENKVFTFNIINNNKLELLSIDEKERKEEIPDYKDGLKIGMTFSIK